jgi:23S rRNA (uracil1939-C5)-methyltransferase
MASVIDDESLLDEVLTIEVRVDALAPGGDAVGRQVGGAHDGRATFLPLAAPGEQVRARLTRQKARVAWAELIAVATPSPARVTPPCRFFGVCGGCQWQHVGLEAQRAAKQAIVERALPGIAVALIAPSETGQGYRDRARLVVGGNGAVGFRARRDHTVVDIDQCWLLAPELGRALTAVRTLASGWQPGTEIELQLGAEGVHVMLDGPAAARALDPARLLASLRPAGVVGVTVGGPTRRAGAADVDIAEPRSPALRVPAGAFAQVGRAANAALVQAVLQAIGPSPGSVLELYAGSGNFTRHLTVVSSRVVACDQDRAAVERGRDHAPAAAWSAQPPTAVDADTVLADPPRAGLDAENLRAALQARRRFVYVSCDPQTLSRDAVRLRSEGFVLKHAVALDLMPHTFHVEVVATFDRG